MGIFFLFFFLLTPQQAQSTIELLTGEKDLTLKQTCYREDPAAQYAFKDSMIH